MSCSRPPTAGIPLRTAAFSLLLAVAVPLAAPLQAQNSSAWDPETMAPDPVDGRSTVYAPNGMVATSQPLASEAALRILRQGGNAFDAAVAASAVLSLVEPHMTNVGGDLFALAWSAEEGGLVGLDASGRAGSLMTPERIAADGFDDIPYRGAGSVTVPGAVAGWEALVEGYGSLSLAEVLAPAIEYAENGFPVSPIIARQWGGLVGVLERDEGAAATYLIDGEAPEVGTWFRNPDLAATLRMIAEGGADAFYRGDFGARLAEGIRELGGYITPDDMAAMEVDWVEPLSVDYKGWTIWELPPAGQGIAALEMFELLEPFDLQAMGHNSPEYLHHLIEAKKVAYADLAHVADRDWLEVDPAQLLDPDYLDERRALIDPTHASEQPEPGDFATQTETVYLSIGDAEGNMISFIHSIFEYFGSGVVVPGTGFVLQNRGAGFDIEPGPNQVAPGKRPFHTLIPGFVTKEGEPYMAFGVMGGSMQPQGHVQLVLNMLEFGMDAQEAVDAARFRHRGGLRVSIENLTPELELALESMGHELGGNPAFGGAQVVIRLPGGGYAGASDARKDGLAIGH
jgi:gamma-glutamyltranspeptidase/glutathione hydrolase